MNFKDLLQTKGIAPEKVLVFRHRPRERELRKVLPWLATTKPDVFNAYQQTQPEKIEREIQRAEYVAAFIGQEPGRALFVGLYAVKGWKRITRRGYWQIPANVELKKFGVQGLTKESPRSSQLWFDLALTDFCADWKGKLRVRWPPLDRNWHRWAHKPKNEMPVLAVLDENALVGLDLHLRRGSGINSIDREIVRAAEQIRSRSHGQGISISPAARQAIEAYAMARATAYYAKNRYTVRDVSKTQSYDLHCERNGKVLYVEVKGTQTAGDEIILTPGEVRLARDKCPNTELFVWHSVTVVEGNGAPAVKGGHHRLVSPWNPEDAMLEPLGYSCCVPRGDRKGRRSF